METTSIPLTRKTNEVEDEEEGVMQQRKGKERLRESEPERELVESPIFNTGIMKMKKGINVSLVY